MKRCRIDDFPSFLSTSVVDEIVEWGQLPSEQLKI
jgi:hypothetical protein